MLHRKEIKLFDVKFQIFHFYTVMDIFLSQADRENVP